MQIESHFAKFFVRFMKYAKSAQNAPTTTQRNAALLSGRTAPNCIWSDAQNGVHTG